MGLLQTMGWFGMVPLIENNSCVDWSWGDKASRDHKQRQAEGIAHQHHGKHHADQDRVVEVQTDRRPLGLVHGV